MNSRACKPPATRTGKCLADFGYKFLRQKSPGTRHGALTRVYRRSGWTRQQIKERLRWLANVHRKNTLSQIIKEDLRWFTDKYG